MDTSNLQAFIRNEVFWLIIAGMLFLGIKSWLAQKMLKLIGVIAVGFLLIGISQGWDFMPLMRWILGLFGITV